MEKTKVIEFPKATKPDCSNCAISGFSCDNIPSFIFEKLGIDGCCIRDDSTLRSLWNLLSDYYDAKEDELFLLQIEKAVVKLFEALMVLSPTAALGYLSVRSSFDWKTIFAGLLFDAYLTWLISREAKKEDIAYNAEFQNRVERVRDDQRKIADLLGSIESEDPNYKVKKIGTK